MELKSRSDVTRILAAFAELSKAEKGREIARLMTIIAQNNIAPVIIDQNALLDNYFRYGEDFAYVLEALHDYEDTYLVIIHNRRPDLSAIGDRW